MAERQLTSLLVSVNLEREGAFAELVEAVYGDLKRIAAKRMAEAFEQPLQCLTVQPTAIANDAVMAIVRQAAEWRGRGQFFAVATMLIVRLVKDYQRHRLAAKRGSGQRAVSVRPGEEVAAERAVEGEGDLVAALDRLSEEHPRAAEVVTLHVLCEEPLARVAERLGVSLPTVERDWRLGRAWIRAAAAGL